MKDKLQKLISDLEKKLLELNSFDAYKNLKISTLPPATEEEILAYEQYLGIQLPPSYRTFLSLHNGYKGLAYPGDMLSITDLMPGGKWHNSVKKWKDTSMRYGAKEVKHAIPIANMGNPNNWAYLDPNKVNPRTRELKIIEWEPEDSEEYSNLLKFLEECLETVIYGIEEAITSSKNN